MPWPLGRPHPHGATRITTCEYCRQDVEKGERVTVVKSASSRLTEKQVVLMSFHVDCWPKIRELVWKTGMRLREVGR